MRYLLHYSIKRFMRDGARSITVPLVALTLAVLLNSLTSIRLWIEVQYEDAMDNFPVYAELSDLSGDNTSDLRVGLQDIVRFTDSEATLSLYEYTDNLALRRTFESLLTADDREVTLLGITGIQSDEILHDGDVSTISYFDGYDESVFLSNKLVAVISEDLLNNVQDNEIAIKIIVEGSYEYVFDPELNPGVRVDGGRYILREYFVLGEVLEDADSLGGRLAQREWYTERTLQRSQVIYTNIYMDAENVEVSIPVVGTVSGLATNIIYAPFWAVSTLSEEEIGVPTYSEMLRLTVADNHELSAFKGTAFLTYASVGPIHDTRPFAITVFELEFYETLEPLRLNAIIMDMAMPIVYIISLIVGFQTSMLLTRQRMAEVALFRSIGASRFDLFMNSVFEQVILCAIGATLGTLGVALISGYLNFEHTAILLGTYALGATLSALKSTKSNVLSTLRDKE